MPPAILSLGQRECYNGAWLACLLLKTNRRRPLVRIPTVNLPGPHFKELAMYPNRLQRRLCRPLAALSLGLILLVGTQLAAADEETPSSTDPLMLGGCGGVYLLAEPGPLEIEVVKRDRNGAGRHTELRAILVGPDRRVLQEKSIPDDGQPKESGLGPAKSVTLSTDVPRKGVYALNVTVSQDRYGTAMYWGFRTNCPKFLVETARGHKDARHEEPIVLAGAGRAAEVCFHPRDGEFELAASGLPEEVDALSLRRRDGSLVKRIPVDSGQATAALAAAERREGIPWRLQLPSARATLEIGGLTRWRSGDLVPNVCAWTNKADSWFSLLEHRWLLTPYHRTVYGDAGTTGEITFQVHNNADRSKQVRLELEFPGEPWPARLQDDEVTAGPGGTVPVAVEYTVPKSGETRQCHVRVTPLDTPDFTTYSTLIVKAGRAPATEPLAMPIQLKPYRHENAQFGYLPDYPLDYELYFDSKNRPFARVDQGLAALRDDGWATTELKGPSVRSTNPALEGAAYGLLTSKVAFDADNDVYLLAAGKGKAAYLHSTDGGRSFTAYLVPGRRGRFDIEQFSGHNVPEYPPPFVRFVQTRGSEPGHFWRREHDLELFLPREVEGRIEFGDPVLISKLGIGLAAHSGIPSTVVSRGDKVHVVWAEASDPEASREEIPGVPTYVVTYDRRTKQLGEPALVGYGPPPNDVHNTPSLTIDGEGYLHVLAGTHGRPFPYAKSLKPNDAGGGWTEAVTTGEGLRQTYIGLVCGPDGTLHSAFRLWQTGEPFPHSIHATLAYQRKRPGQPWEAPKILCRAAFSEYSVFYHRLTIDHRGRLFLSKDYWSTHWFYRNDHRGDRRSVLMSADGGDTWTLASGDDLQ
jgi:hypothetical protein